ncbi:glycosyltransferase [Leptospira borgpetersenii]|uniref:Glycosyltransferase, group 1 family protein n=2 Tax=Leptospira borgpetersenii TaxID=174 RepID=A0ABN0HWM4_LEPBO|nr:glycosyltransferase [Leptospira borgpetersenii]AXX14326.1 glycosyltransferase family 1 protein [Leptospira borgpetersenii serovar Ceylonica]EKP13095.1 glycosyltransferase, group 1 family protein [Leptospira borgpetersenii str. 200801926]EKQ91864.1 glycosyltransferase, group 1 family protein [Leptospira borgpetersenii str. UI 09149]ENO65054.1 glycosyltransferase, group 1 family protein [Leptospira borgpetersenii serovar Mini str. 201000851]EPG58158.1 glycosyltransferase, group 1 family prote
MKPSLKKIAVVSPIFSDKVSGGSEKLIFQLVELLATDFEITVLTTRSLDYITWKNSIPIQEKIFFYEGTNHSKPIRFEEKTSSLGGKYKILQFTVEKQRNIERFNRLSKKILERPSLQNKESINHWLIEQGPYVPELIQFIESRKSEYDVFFFVSYLYYPLVFGIPLVAEKSIIIPTFHDEPPAYLPVYKEILTDQSSYSFNTPEELNVFRNILGYKPSTYSITGMNLNLGQCSSDPGSENNYADYHHKNTSSDNKNETLSCQLDFSDKAEKSMRRSLRSASAGFGTRCKSSLEKNSNREETPFLLYVGRVDQGKGFLEMAEWFLEWKKNSKLPHKLKIAGKIASKIPNKILEDQNIEFLGFVEEQIKFELLQNCVCLINSSPLESFSIVLMEAWLKGKPALVNGKSDVLKGHCLRSNGGLFYFDRKSFFATLDFILDHPKESFEMGMSGKKYVEQNFNPKTVREKLLRLIDKTIQKKYASS